MAAEKLGLAREPKLKILAYALLMLLTVAGDCRKDHLPTIMSNFDQMTFIVTSITKIAMIINMPRQRQCPCLPLTLRAGPARRP